MPWMPLQICGGHVASQIGCLALWLCLASEMAIFRVYEIEIVENQLEPMGLVLFPRGCFSVVLCPRAWQHGRKLCDESKCNLPSSDSIANHFQVGAGLAISLQLKSLSSQCCAAQSFLTACQVKFLVLPVETAAAEDCPRHHPKVDAERAGPVLVSSSYLCRNLSNIFRMALAVSVHPQSTNFNIMFLKTT